MTFCGARRYLWGGFTCTRSAGHDGDHAAEGRVNHRTGRAVTLATWPDTPLVAAELDADAPRRIKWKRVEPGRYVGRIGREVRFAMTRVGSRWIVTENGGVVWSAATVAEAKDVGERYYKQEEQQ